MRRCYLFNQYLLFKNKGCIVLIFSPYCATASVILIHLSGFEHYTLRNWCLWSLNEDIICILYRNIYQNIKLSLSRIRKLSFEWIGKVSVNIISMLFRKTKVGSEEREFCNSKWRNQESWIQRWIQTARGRKYWTNKRTGCIW